jgi:hypothetical protein
MFRSTRVATRVVVASDANERNKTEADYVCDGTADDVEIQAAVDTLPVNGGKVILSEGIFTLSNQITRAIDGINIEGNGEGTRINLDGATATISAGSQNGWLMENFDTDAGGVDVASASESVARYWVDGTWTESGAGGAHDAVTLAGTPDYITISGQTITRGTIDISDDTNLVATTGAVLTGDTLTVDHDAATNFASGEHFTMLDEDDMVTDSATQAATQQSIKAYVDTQGHTRLHTHNNTLDGNALVPLSVEITDYLRMTGEYLDTTIPTGDNDNYQPVAASPGAGFLINCTGGASTITGIVPEGQGQMIFLWNYGDSPLTLAHDRTSTAANRFYLSGGNDIVLNQYEGVWLVYEQDATVFRWIVIGEHRPSSLGRGGITLTVASSTALNSSSYDYECDGTDDDVQIQAAIDAVGAGGRVLLSEGTFVVSGDSITLDSNVHLQGMGMGVTTVQLKASAGANTSRIIDNTASESNIVISDISFDGNEANSNSTDTDGTDRDEHAALYLGAITNLTIKNVEVTETYAGAAIRLGSCTNVTINNVYLHNNKDTSAGSSFTCDDLFMGDCANVQITNSKFFDCSDTGIATDGSDFITITGCNVVGPDDNGITCTGSASGTASNITISGNVIGSQLDGNHAIRCWDNSVNNVSNISITGNVFRTGTEYAVGLGTGASEITITGNVVDPDQSADASFVRFEGNPDNVVVTGNTMVAGSTYGIDYASGTPTNILISNNDLSNASTPVNGSPAGTRFLNNAGYTVHGFNNENLTAINSIFMDEQAAADADVAGDGQYWVRNDVPNIPMFTDDAGDDLELAILRLSKTTLTHTNITNLATTPITLVAAPGAGYVLLFDSALFRSNNSVAYTETNDDLVIEYAGGTDVSNFANANSLVSTTDSVDHVTTLVAAADHFGWATALANVENVALQLDNPNTNWGAGDAANTMDVYVYYRVLKL